MCRRQELRHRECACYFIGLIKPMTQLPTIRSNVKPQTISALKAIETILKAAGSSFDRIVKVTVLLTRPQDFAGMNKAYAEFFTANKPARAVAKLGVEIPGVLVSIEATALA